MKVAERLVDIDGIRYDLSVRDEGIGFYGGAFCHTCWTGFVKYELVSSIDDAFAQAMVLAEKHQAEKHRLVGNGLFS